MCICPIFQRVCRKTDCAWFQDGECVVTSLPELVENLEVMTDALKEVKRGIDSVATNL